MGYIWQEEVTSPTQAEVPSGVLTTGTVEVRRSGPAINLTKEHLALIKGIMLRCRESAERARWHVTERRSCHMGGIEEAQATADELTTKAAQLTDIYNAIAALLGVAA